MQSNRAEQIKQTALFKQVLDVTGFKLLKFLNKRDRQSLAKVNKFTEPKVTTFDIFGMMVSAVSQCKKEEDNKFMTQLD